jgi:hypothetical protein
MIATAYDVIIFFPGIILPRWKYRRASVESAVEV